MKRIVFVAILMLSVMTANGRTDSINNISRHEVRVGAAFIIPDTKAYDDYTDEIMEAGFDVLASDDTPDDLGSSLSIEYYYHINKTFAIGALFGKQYGHSCSTYFTDPDLQLPFVATKNSRVLYAMPAVKAYWLNSQLVNFYVKIAGGFVSSKIKTEADGTSLFTTGAKKKMTFEGQFSLLCCELNLNGFGMHFELGGGAQGVLIIGASLNL
ncbi:MAG: hypothetical protein J6Q93_05955 [Prevotella sp.]|nr:hypothetical protein [Prevotella sp.]